MPLRREAERSIIAPGIGGIGEDISTRSALIIAAGLAVAAFVAGGRYDVRTTGDYVFIIDRLNGEGRSCMHVGACFDME